MSATQPAYDDFLELLASQIGENTEATQHGAENSAATQSDSFSNEGNASSSFSVTTMDHRIESIVMECLAKGIVDTRIESLFHLLGWRQTVDCFTVAGSPRPGFDAASVRIRSEVRNLGGNMCIVARSGTQCIALIGIQAAVTPETTCTAILPAFDDAAPVCLGPTRHGIDGASQSIIGALTAIKAAPAIHPIPHPMRADDVLPERALLGDEGARDELVLTVYGSLRGDNPDDPTLATVDAFLQSGSSLDITARELNVHPNTVRYRLKRASETTGWDATDPREAFVLQTAIALGRIREAQERQ